MYRPIVYCALLTILALYTLKTSCEEKSPLYLDEIRSLSELPMERLIQIRSSFARNDDEDENENINASNRRWPLTLPIALPFIKDNDEKPIRRYHEEKGDSKISKIFQLSVTALSFLAFGGYLLTLIIMSLRRQNNNPGNATANSVIIFPSSQRVQMSKRPKRNILIFDPMENNFETEKLYEGMIMLSRSYALYH